MEIRSKLILVGGGGHCKSVINVAKSLDCDIVGILDNMPVGTMVLDVPVIGNDDLMPSLVEEYGYSAGFIITVGQLTSSSLRRKIAQKIANAGGVLAPALVAPTALIGMGAELGNGTVILNNAVINADAVIGDNVIINTGAIIEHECSVGDFTHVSTGAIVNGMSSVGTDCLVGSHATVSNCINVCSNTVIGAGATVVNDIEAPGTYVGCPAHLIK